MSKKKPYRRKVFYYETDQMGIVHHSNYIRWFEEARIHYLEQSGHPYDGIERRGLMIPVLSASCEYRLAVRFGETVRIETEIVEFKGLKFKIVYEVYDKHTVDPNDTRDTTQMTGGRKEESVAGCPQLAHAHNKTIKCSSTNLWWVIQ